jgi:hypothetical protein
VPATAVLEHLEDHLALRRRPEPGGAKQTGDRMAHAFLSRDPPAEPMAFSPAHHAIASGAPSQDLRQLARTMHR